MGRSRFLGLLILSIVSYEAYSAIVYNAPTPPDLGDNSTLYFGANSGLTEILFEAIESKDHDRIMNILARCSLEDRLDISKLYKMFYSQDLRRVLSDILSGDFKNLLLAMMTPTTEYYAGEIWNAVAGLGTDEDSLDEIFITLTNDQIKESSEFYYEAHQETVEAAIIDDTSGFYKDFLVSLSHADRNETQTLDVKTAVEDAKTLSNDTRFATFNDIFSHRSYSQLNLTFQEYRYYYEETIETVIENNFSGDLKNALLALTEKVQNEAAYFARRFYESMAGWGTRDSVLIRLAVTRSEIDIDEIKAEYRNRYSNTLAADIIDDTSGDYRKCLLILIGEDDVAKSTEFDKEAKSSK